MVDAIERWLPVVGWEGWYEVSDHGRIRRVGKANGATPGHILAQQRNQRGYATVALRRPGVRERQFMHRLVLLAFVGPPPDGHECNHKNGIRTDARLANLEWMTHPNNLRHAVQTGLKPTLRGQQLGRATKLNPDQVREIRRLKNVIPSWEIAEQFGVKRRAVLAIWAGESWGWLP
jgi:hypothetical protein